MKTFSAIENNFLEQLARQFGQDTLFSQGDPPITSPLPKKTVLTILTHLVLIVDICFLLFRKQIADIPKTKIDSCFPSKGGLLEEETFGQRHSSIWFS